MRIQASKAVALLGGVATLALGSGFMLRLAAPKQRPPLAPCAPRLLELERAVCEPPVATHRLSERLAELSLHAPD
jgi:hypothetical protein